MRSSSAWNPPVVAPPVETVPVTPAELATLKGGGGLEANTIYEVPTSEATGGVVFLYATSPTTVSYEADYYDVALANQTFPIHYDCPADRIDRMWDPERDVEVRGSDQVNAFPWGNVAITETVIDHANLTYTAGTITGLKLENNSFLDMQGGDILEVTISEDSSYTQSAGYLRYSEISSRSIVTNSGTQISDSSFSNEAEGTFSGGTFTNSTVTSGGRVVQSNGTIFETEVTSRALVRFTGTGRIYYSSISSAGLLHADNWSGNFYYNEISESSLVGIDGSDGNIQRNKIKSNAKLYWRNGTANFYYNTVGDGATADFDGSVAISIRYNSIDSYAFVTIKGATGGSLLYSKVQSRGYILSNIGWSGTVSYVTISANGQLNNADNFSGFITQTVIQSRARVYATDFVGAVRYCSFTNISYVYLERSAMDIYGCTVSESYFFARDAVAGSRARDLNLSGYARFYGQFMGATGYAEKNNIQSYGVLYMRNGAAGVVRYCNISSSSYILADTLTGAYQRTEAHAYARVIVTHGAGTSTNNNYTTGAYTIAAVTSNEVLGY